MYKKKGQATPFIIIGIIIVVIAIIVIVVYKPEFISPRLSESQLNPIRNYVEDCVEDVLDRSLIVLKENAGHYSRVGAVNIYGFSYLTQGTYEANDVIEGRISSDVETILLSEECDLDVFDQYEIIKGEIEVETEIGWHDVVVNVNYPLKIKKEGVDLELNEFVVSKKDEFGLMNAVAGKIINNEDYDENSIFKGEEFTVTERIDNAGNIFTIDTPYTDKEYNFII